MVQESQQPPPVREDPRDEPHPLAATALLISLGAVIVSWFVFRGEAPNDQEIAVVVLLGGAVLTIAWRIGRGR